MSAKHTNDPTWTHLPDCKLKLGGSECTCPDDFSTATMRVVSRMTRSSGETIGQRASRLGFKTDADFDSGRCSLEWGSGPTWCKQWFSTGLEAWYFMEGYERALDHAARGIVLTGTASS